MKINPALTSLHLKNLETNPCEKKGFRLLKIENACTPTHEWIVKTYEKKYHGLSRVAWAILATLATIASFFFGLFSPKVQNLWRHVFTGKEIVVVSMDQKLRINDQIEKVKTAVDFKIHEENLSDTRGSLTENSKSLPEINSEKKIISKETNKETDPLLDLEAIELKAENSPQGLQELFENDDLESMKSILDQVSEKDLALTPHLCLGSARSKEMLELLVNYLKKEDYPLDFTDSINNTLSMYLPPHVKTINVELIQFALDLGMSPIQSIDKATSPLQTALLYYNIKKAHGEQEQCDNLHLVIKEFITSIDEETLNNIEFIKHHKFIADNEEIQKLFDPQTLPNL